MTNPHLTGRQLSRFKATHPHLNLGLTREDIAAIARHCPLSDAAEDEEPFPATWTSNSKDLKMAVVIWRGNMMALGLYYVELEKKDDMTQNDQKIETWLDETRGNSSARPFPSRLSASTGETPINMTSSNTSATPSSSQDATSSHTISDIADQHPQIDFTGYEVGKNPEHDDLLWEFYRAMRAERSEKRAVKGKGKEKDVLGETF